MYPQKTKTLPIHKICTCPQHGVHLAKYPVLLDRQSCRLSNHVTLMTADPQTGVLRDWPCGCFLGVTPAHGVAGEEGPSPGHHSVRRLCSTQLEETAKCSGTSFQAARQAAWLVNQVCKSVGSGTKLHKGLFWSQDVLN